MSEQPEHQGDELAYQDTDSQLTQLEVLSEVGAAVLGLGTGIMVDPVGGVVVGAAAGPLLKATFERVFGFRSRQIVRMLGFAEQAAGRKLEELLKQVTADPDRAQLFSAAARAATNTALESKLRVLGQLLVDGLIHQDHEVNEARLLLSAVEEVERTHLRVLDCLSNSYRERLSEQEQAAAAEKGEPDAWPFERLAEELDVSPSALELTIGTLSGNNLVHGSADVYGGNPSVPRMAWRLTAPGRAVLKRFQEAGESAAGVEASEHHEGEQQTQRPPSP
jgi:hypothetical protein